MTPPLTTPTGMRCGDKLAFPNCASMASVGLCTTTRLELLLILHNHTQSHVTYTYLNFLSESPPTYPKSSHFTMPAPNFTQCGLTYMSSPSLIARYNYSGRVRNIPANPLTQITYEGCTALCGSGSAYYPWAEISATITTWVLPILGTLLQAPFESNAFWRTVKALNRWIGSPISSLACILWDIEIGGKCALFGRDIFSRLGCTIAYGHTTCY
jgi:hypothetical protein